MKILLSVIPSEEIEDRKSQSIKIAHFGGNLGLTFKMLTARDVTLTMEWSFLLSQTCRNGRNLKNIKVMKIDEN